MMTVPVTHVMMDFVKMAYTLTAVNVQLDSREITANITQMTA